MHADCVCVCLSFTQHKENKEKQTHQPGKPNLGKAWCGLLTYPPVAFCFHEDTYHKYHIIGDENKKNVSKIRRQLGNNGTF